MAEKPKRQKALVTGASTGIGAAFAKRLARDGFDLIVVARDRKRLESLAESLDELHGTKVEVLPADLTAPSELREVEKRVAKEAALEMLVNNAGFGTVGAFAKLDVDREEEEVRLNVVALLRLTRAALPGMIERGRGTIINVSSLAAFQPVAANATYAATKSFVNTFTESLHEELRGTGVQVQVLCPGFTRTEFQKRAGIGTSGLPAFAWMSAEDVVTASMAGVQNGDLICIPGFSNRLMAAAVRASPRSLVRRAVGMGAARMLK